jgi:hypothetical protein
LQDCCTVCLRSCLQAWCSVFSLQLHACDWLAPALGMDH